MDDIEDTRRKRLSEWMENRRLTQTEVAHRVVKTRSYISLILSAGKSFGEKTARQIETGLGMPANYLDGDVQAPQADSRYSPQANILAATFDALRMDDATAQNALIAATQTLIDYSNQRLLPPSSSPAPVDVEASKSGESHAPVSYTHLTLPTIYSV